MTASECLPPAKIELQGVSKIYETAQGTIEALAGIDLTVYEREFLCIIGPSGCGKSTLLRIVADLCPRTSGELIFNSSAQQTKPLTAMVFQEYAIFPWRTVLDNVCFGLEMRGVPKKERHEIAEHYIRKVGLTKFTRRFPHELSGGMKQRVALARALANDPQILLMDEPFGALDAQTRTLLQQELLRIWEEERKTILYVTHSIDEALLLGDRIVLMTARPGTVKTEYQVDFPRPREIKIKATEKFGVLYYEIWQALKEEVQRSMVEEAL